MRRVSALVPRVLARLARAPPTRLITTSPSSLARPGLEAAVPQRVRPHPCRRGHHPAPPTPAPFVALLSPAG